MADWEKIYERAEDRHLERLKQQVARHKAKMAQQEQQPSSQDMTGTTTTLEKEKPQG